MLKVGDSIWWFDCNRRVYAKDSGRTSGPVYREHWCSLPISGETSRSWLIGNWPKPLKAPKTGPHPGFAFTEEEVDNDCWVRSHRAGISDAVMRCRDASQLRAIADILGWKPREE